MTEIPKAPGSPIAVRASSDRPTKLHTSAGDVALHEYHVTLDGRAWKILHTGAVLTEADEQRLLNEEVRLPYGISLWPASIALAHEIVARGREVGGKRILELGAGTGLPGIVASSLGARVVQTDNHQAALHLCELNGGRNGVTNVEYRLDDWKAWSDATRYDWILASDVLYAPAMHPHLRHIFESNLAPGGRILLADPFRRRSFELLESLEAGGWKIAVDRWRVGEAGAEASIGVYELARPSV